MMDQESHCEIPISWIPLRCLRRTSTSCGIRVEAENMALKLWNKSGKLRLLHSWEVNIQSNLIYYIRDTCNIPSLEDIMYPWIHAYFHLSKVYDICTYHNCIIYSSHKVLQRMDLLQPASLRSGVRRSDNQSDTKRYPNRYPNLACVTPRPHSRAPKQHQQQHWAHFQKDKQLRYHWRAPLLFCLKQGQLVRRLLSANGLSLQGHSRQNGKSQSSSSDSSSSSSTEDEEDM